MVRGENYNREQREHIATLLRRRRWLRHCLAENTGRTNYNRQEINALTWILSELVKARGEWTEDEQTEAGT